MTNAYFNCKEAMAYIGIKSKTTFAKYIAAGLPVVIVNGSKRISKSDIDAFMADHKVVNK